MNKSIVWTIVIIVVLAAGVWWYMSAHRAVGPSPESSSTLSGGMSSMPTSTGGNEAASGTPLAAVTVNVLGNNYHFNPEAITVKQGQTVTIHFVSSGGMHDFVLPDFNVSTPRISSGQSADVTFVASKTGSFEYYCSVSNHRAMGMRGTFIVQ